MPTLGPAGERACLHSLDIPGSVVDPVMGPFHVLLQVALAFARIRAVWVLAIEFVRYRTVFVVEVPVSLLLGWPTVLVVLARWLTAFPGPRMGLLVFTVTRVSDSTIFVRYGGWELTSGHMASRSSYRTPYTFAPISTMTRET